MQVDLNILQLICSRLCHDLAGPMGAVGAGLEVIGEGGPDTASALALAQEAAGQATRRLAFFRVAFGRGGLGRPAEAAEVRTLADGYFGAGPVRLDWGAEPPPTGRLTADASKLLLNLLLLGAASLPRGGTLGVKLADLPEGLGAAITASGRDARLAEDTLAALAPAASAEALTPHSVQAYFAAKLAEHLGAGLEVEDARPAGIRIAALLPVAAP